MKTLAALILSTFAAAAVCLEGAGCRGESANQAMKPCDRQTNIARGGTSNVAAASRRLLKMKKKSPKNDGKNKGKKTKSPAPSVPPSNAPSSPPSLSGDPAMEVCLNPAMLQVWSGPTTDQFCDGFFNLENAAYATQVNGVAIVNREDAGGDGSVSQNNCFVPWKFEADVDGSSGVCISNTCADTSSAAGTCSKQKGAIEYWPLFPSPVSVTQLEAIEYRVNIQSCGANTGTSTACLNKLYVNLYTVAPSQTSTTCSFYTCKFDFGLTPTTVSPPLATTDDPTGEWLTYTIDADTVATSFKAGTGGCACPTAITALASKTLRNIREVIEDDPVNNELNLGLSIQNGAKYAMTFNMGDTSATDNGMTACYDYFSYKLKDENTIKFDFNAAPGP